jgi:hypothetical protein
MTTKSDGIAERAALVGADGRIDLALAFRQIQASVDSLGPFAFAQGGGWCARMAISNISRALSDGDAAKIRLAAAYAVLALAMRLRADAGSAPGMMAEGARLQLLERAENSTARDRILN